MTTHAPESPASQAYRGAGAGLLHLAGERTLKVIAVTGAGEREGKTAVTGNLAVVLGAERQSRGCRLVRPSESHPPQILRASNDVGVTDVLRAGPFSTTRCSQPMNRASWSSPADRCRGIPPSSWGSEGEELFAELRSRFDFVLLDAGPGLVADVLFLVRHADGIIVVADAAKTSRSSVAHLRHQLKSVGGHIIGGILHNRAPLRADRASRYSPRSSRRPRTPGVRQTNGPRRQVAIREVGVGTG